MDQLIVSQIPAALQAALDLYGLNAEALQAQPQGWYIGDVVMPWVAAAGVAYTGAPGQAQILDVMEQTDPRIGAFGTDGAFILALSVRHRIFTTPEAFDVAQYPNIARQFAALSCRWTPSTGQPAYTMLGESLDAWSFANRRENADMADALQAAGY